MLNGQSSGKVIGSDANGKPELQEPTALTHQQQIDAANEAKFNLMQSATNAIAPLQDAVDSGEANQNEEAQLKAWKKYRMLLIRVETSTVSDIEWPEKPLN
ncbi:tail fiber assembly protein [Pantoea sp. SS70]|nr:tail fiber assembly protein [Pantoea sp. SS70]WGK59197.1 tail fiber assembly protein [Pantoea sp. SS70]